eukprot:352257-Chlamydomonas_euryale.AAC.3
MGLVEAHEESLDLGAVQRMFRSALLRTVLQRTWRAATASTAATSATGSWTAACCAFHNSAVLLLCAAMLSHMPPHAARRVHVSACVHDGAECCHRHPMQPV